MNDMMRLVTDWLFVASQHTIAAICLLLAALIYVYSFLDRRVPSFLVTPIIAALIYFGAYTYGDINGSEDEKLACNIRLDAARQDLYDRYAKAALTLRYIEKQYNDDKVEMANKEREYQKELDELLVSLQTERANGAKDEVENVVTSNKTKSCLATPVPDSILRNLNKSRG